jgi:hypothetical protein
MLGESRRIGLQSIGTFAGMVDSYGERGAIRKLLVSPNIETGLNECWRLSRLDITAEYAALLHNDEFTPAELDCAVIPSTTPKRKSATIAC